MGYIYGCISVKDKLPTLSQIAMTAYAGEWCFYHDISELISVNTCPCFAEIKKAKKKETVKLPQSKRYFLGICELLLPLRHS